MSCNAEYWLLQKYSHVFLPHSNSSRGSSCVPRHQNCWVHVLSCTTVSVKSERNNVRFRLFLKYTLLVEPQGIYSKRNLLQKEHERTRSLLRREGEQPSALQHPTMLFKHVAMLFRAEVRQKPLTPWLPPELHLNNTQRYRERAHLEEMVREKKEPQTACGDLCFSPRRAVNPSVSFTKRWPVCTL